MSVFDPHLIHPTVPHHLSHGGLDRNDLARSDTSFIERLFDLPSTRYVIVWRALNFFKHGEAGLSAMQCLSLNAVAQFLDGALSIYLGKDRNENEYVCLDISSYDEDRLISLSNYGQFGDLREAAPSIAGDDGSILAYAKAMCIGMHGWIFAASAEVRPAPAKRAIPGCVGTQTVRQPTFPGQIQLSLLRLHVKIKSCLAVSRYGQTECCLFSLGLLNQGKH